MHCPFCKCTDTIVKDSRPTEDGAAIRRRRQCPECDARFTTFERVQMRELKVIKRDGTKEVFSYDKLHKSLSIALRKREISDETLDKLINSISRELEKTGESEFSTTVVGEYVMKALAQTDPVGYVRYASVYRDFSKPEDFNRFIEDELKHVLEQDKTPAK
ncbi:transcriptional regulator NrdR [Pseudaquidulcibacter saccharophilus]|uniref:transcriptional regulator NrdR n=1 Tax=Pseudaquidulcibacter saccharophilus TaxID=2831900 RepID=UPI001EFF5713|nr:transcriptional regulator NrdR [Pseudaquidulcibacter saccharophilus]